MSTMIMVCRLLGKKGTLQRSVTTVLPTVAQISKFVKVKNVSLESFSDKCTAVKVKTTKNGPIPCNMREKLEIAEIFGLVKNFCHSEFGHFRSRVVVFVIFTFTKYCWVEKWQTWNISCKKLFIKNNDSEFWALKIIFELENLNYSKSSEILCSYVQHFNFSRMFFLCDELVSKYFNLLYILSLDYSWIVFCLNAKSLENIFIVRYKYGLDTFLHRSLRNNTINLLKLTLFCK